MNKTTIAPSDLEKRLTLLRQFRILAKRWFNGDYEDNEKDKLRSEINRDLIAVRQLVLDAGTMRLVTVGPPPAIGGMMVKNADPFQNFFNDFWGMSLIPTTIDCIEQAAGVFQHMLEHPGLIQIQKKETIDIEMALERALRPSFRKEKPASERDVQDGVENVLNALGIEFEREREVAPVAGKKFIPDFTVQSLDLAIEVKFAKNNHGESAIQEELSADISGYGTKWKHLLAVVYDLGVIADPWRFRNDNQKHFGVTVIVIKH